MLDLSQYLHHPLQGFLVVHGLDCCHATKQMLSVESHTAASFLSTNTFSVFCYTGSKCIATSSCSVLCRVNPIGSSVWSIGGLPSHQKLAASRYATHQRRERLLKQIQGLDVPHLRTELTGAYNLAVEIYEFGGEGARECGYFDSLMDYAPRSQATREIRRLTDELINVRM